MTKISNKNPYIWNAEKKEISLPNTKTGAFFVLKTKKYQFLELIGKGANGVVIKALNKTLNRIEAIKIWLPNRSKNTNNVDINQYLEEVRKIANIKKNPNIVTMYDAWEQDGYYLASTEYIEGKNLKDWLKAPFYAGEIERREIARQLLETVLYYQSEGIIHGDMHSGNILIDNNNQVHIIDFGSSYFTRNKKNGRISIDREINLLYEDIKEILGDSFNEELLKLDFKIKNQKRMIITDSINHILFTKTLLQYQKIISFKETAEKIIDNDALEEYCSFVADGFYFNPYKIIEDLNSWSTINNVIDISEEYLQRIIFGNIFIEDWLILPYHTYELLPGNKYYANEIEAVSAYVYYELAKGYFSEENFKITKTIYFKRYKGILDDTSFDTLWKKLENFKDKTLFEIIKSNSFNNNSAIISNYLEYIRSILSTLLNICYKPLDYYFLLWIRITEVRLNNNLHEKIMNEIAANFTF